MLSHRDVPTHLTLPTALHERARAGRPARSGGGESPRVGARGRVAGTVVERRHGAAVRAGEGGLAGPRAAPHARRLAGRVAPSRRAASIRSTATTAARR